MDITELRKLAFEYAVSGKGDWLNEFRWFEIPVSEIIGIEGERQAQYRPLAGEILLAPDDSLPFLFGSYIHELYHAWQRNRYTLLPYFAMLGLARPLMERGAKAAELDAVQWACDNRACRGVTQ